MGQTGAVVLKGMETNLSWIQQSYNVAAELLGRDSTEMSESENPRLKGAEFHPKRFFPQWPVYTLLICLLPLTAAG